MTPVPLYKAKCQFITDEIIKKVSVNDKKSYQVIPKVNERYQEIWKGF
jgi:hypothetical protein